MSHCSRTPSLCSLSYPEDGDIFELRTPSPIDYERSVAGRYKDSTGATGLSSYDNLYIFYDATEGWQTSREPLPYHTNSREGSFQRGSEGDVPVECPSLNFEANHPGPPWFRWHASSGHSGYRVQHQGRTIQCPYLRYEVRNGIPYEMGTEGAGETQFAQERFAELQPLLEVPGVDDRDLEIFVKDVPFNFAFEQVLESLRDPGVLAEVARLRNLVVQVPIYAELACSVQELSETVHKFQKGFNDRAGQLVIHLETTKRRMEAARIRSRAQLVLVELYCTRELRGRFYWPDMPGVPEDLGRHYNRMWREDEGSADVHRWGGSTATPSSCGCISPQYRATQ
jgi:hypothetical protein